MVVLGLAYCAALGENGPSESELAVPTTPTSVKIQHNANNPNDKLTITCPVVHSTYNRMLTWKGSSDP
jgi:hypothetical protein